MNEHYYHCASKGLEADVLFKSEEQFIAGMNRVAICLLSVRKTFSLYVLAFCLMDNHVHFILYGCAGACDMFVEQYRRLTEMWLHFHSENEKGKSWDFGRWQITNKEKLSEKICYVLRNPTAAGFGMHPAGYRWSSANLMFADHGFATFIGKRLSELSGTSQRKLFSTRDPLPDDWLVLPDGMIWPGCYVEFKRAENVFGNVWTFMYELNKKNEDAVNAEMYGGEVSLPDKDVLGIVARASEDLFGESSVNLLTSRQRLEICSYLRRTQGCNIKQLGRLLHLKASEIRSIM